MSAVRVSSIHRVLLAGITAAAMAVGSLVAAPMASADTDPDPGTPATVTADALPTVQIDGVVWGQAIAGNTVFAGGNFATARPAGAAPGQSTVSRPNLLAYDITNGNLVSSWNPAPNAQVLAVATSPDGSRVYVGGSFTTISGVNRYRIAAFDTSTLQLITSFNASVDGRVEAIEATDSTVYVGGAFTAANGQSRLRLAAFSAANGSLLSWNPTADDGIVQGLAISPDESTVIVGGNFTLFNGTSGEGRGLARVDAVSGSRLSFPANSVIDNGGSNGAILSVEKDGEHAYLTGYVYGQAFGTLEGVAAVNWSDGSLAWVADCHGDHYSTYSTGDVVYSASHAHYCGNIGSFGQTDPFASWTYYRGGAFTQEATRVVGREVLGYANFEGQPGPTRLNWFPDINAGTFTGQDQGPWHVTGNGDYVVYGGEFTRVNQSNQQGLVRFAVTDLAPNDEGPRFGLENFPVTARAIAEGVVRVSWQANADFDNENLTYRVIRDGATGSPVYVGTHPSQIWRRPMMGFTDAGLTPGQTYTYRVTVADPFGNGASSSTVSVVADGAGGLGAYAAEVLDDGASHFWRLGETSGPSVRDWAATNDGTAGAGVAFGSPGAIAGDVDGAVDLSSTISSKVLSSQQYLGSNYFSVEAWVRAQSNERGRILGFSNTTSLTGTSGSRDRHLYLDNSGRFNFGVWAGQTRAVTSPAGFNDGTWHHVVGTMGADGLRLFVDGEQVAADASWTTAQNVFGYWNLFADSLSGWPNRPSTDYFAGQVDEVAVYPDVLAPETVQTHYLLGTGALNADPVAVFTSSVDGLGVGVDGSGSSDPDGSVVSYAWEFGDGGTASGVTASYAYAAAGTYEVTLTVTDDEGATGAVTQQVTVIDVGDAFAADAFARSVAGGWGSADLGGSWSLSGAASSFSVDGAGQMVMPSAGVGRAAVLEGVSQVDADVAVSAWVDKLATGVDLSVIGRWAGPGSDYRVQAKVLADGAVRFGLRRYLAGSSPSTLAQVTVPGLSVAAGDQLRIRVQVEGSSPTTLRAKVWPVGQAEPAAWTLETTDTTAALQGAGGVGLVTYLAGSATNAPVTASFDDFVAGPLGAAPNQPPAAAFASLVDRLDLGVDGSGSSDPDGSVVSYAWEFGDGGTASGVTASHAYAAAGTYDVTLTVTDDEGATGAVTQQVTVAQANQAPVAVFTSSVDGLGVGVDGSGSSDPDGSVVSYAWEFGDGGTASGVTASYAYAAAGTYEVTLTVTDDEGATGAVTQQVTVIDVGDAFAADAFARSVAGGWGSADLGGSWSLSGAASSFSVDGAGQMVMPSAGVGRAAVLEGVSQVDADVAVSAWVDKLATGVDLSVIGRWAGPGSDYRVQAKVLADGAVRFGLRRYLAGSSPSTLAQVTVPGLSVAAGDQLRIRVQVEGSSPTTLRAKVWPVGQAEPAAWTLETTDTTAALQGAGGVGLVTYLAGSATNAPVTASFDDFVAGPLGAAPNQPPAAAFASLVDRLDLGVDGSGSSDPDGSVVSYAWEFGDGGTASGVTASHAYAAAGTYDVTLTVTDDEGATGAVTQQVTVAQANQAPVAVFTSSVDGLGVGVDGSGSSDPDGSVVSYAWEFGDGGTASGVTASYAYAAAGTYEVTLTVTDDEGATGAVTQQVTVIDVGDAFAADAFARSVAGGWGSADLGGSWSLSGAASSFSVDGAGQMVMPSAGVGRAAVLEGVSQVDADVAVSAWVDKLATGVDLSVIGRWAGPGSDYRVQAKVLADGAVRFGLRRYLAGSSPSTLAQVTVPGLSVAAGDQLRIRVQVEGSSPTTLRAKVWPVGQAEPAAWTLETTDTTAALQGAGGVGLVTYLAGSATNAPVTASFDDFVAGPLGAAPNQPPAAAFASLVDRLDLGVDGSGSSDPDGSVVSYAWEFGDGGTASGVTASHAYAAAGTYDVTLTVTDDEGATGAVTQQVTVAQANQAPVAVFTSSVDGLGVGVDGSGSSDPDGSVVSYAWEFGDGGTASGVTASYAYAAAGTYEVTLTVTDDEGATGAVTQQVTVIDVGDAFAADAFARSVAGGWGSADLGGSWSLSGAASSFSVDGAGQMVMPSAGVGRAAVLEGVSQVDADVAVSAWVDKLATGVDLSVIGRWAGPGSDYRVQAKVLADGAVRFGLRRYLAGSSPSTLAQVTVPGLSVAAGDQLRIRVQVEGSSPTTLRAKVWPVGQAEPAAWTLETTDTTAALQGAGGVGLVTYLAGSATNAPVTASFDDFTASPIP